MHDPEFQRMRENVLSGSQTDYTVRDDGMLLFQSRVCVPAVTPIRELILQEAHSSSYAMHPGSTKMYRTLRPNYWWRGMKKDIAEFVSQCLVCQQVKAEHQSPAGRMQPLFIPEWKWDHITMDFVVGLPRTRSGRDAVWVIVDRLTKSTHFLAINMSFSLHQLARIYVNEVVSRHGVPMSIVSDRDHDLPPGFGSNCRGL